MMGWEHYYSSFFSKALTKNKEWKCKKELTKEGEKIKERNTIERRDIWSRTIKRQSSL